MSNEGDKYRSLRPQLDVILRMVDLVGELTPNATEDIQVLQSISQSLRDYVDLRDRYTTTMDKHGDRKIVVKTYDGETVPVSLFESSCVLDVKLAISQLKNVPVSDQRIIYNGKSLYDDATVTNATAGPDTPPTFHMVMNLRGG